MYSWATSKKRKHCRGFLLGCYFSPPIKKGQRNEDKSENEEHWHQWPDRLVNYPLVFIRVLRRFPDVAGRWNLLFAFRWRLFCLFRWSYWQPCCVWLRCVEKNRFTPELNEKEVIELLESATPGSIKKASKYGMKIYQGKNWKLYFDNVSIRVSQSKTMQVETIYAYKMICTLPIRILLTK